VHNNSKCLRIDPDYGYNTYYNRGATYAKLGKYKDAISDYSRAIRMNPDYIRAYSNRGATYAELGNYEDAISDYSRAIRIDPDFSARPYYNRGIAYSTLKNYKAAISDYSRAIRMNPDYDSAYKNRAAAKRSAGLPYCSDYKKACDLGKEECCEWYYKQCR
jgi:tetratricopeptide (TPR) repeat protein